MNTKEIRTKIGSIKNTQKITRAMELVAASKMRKAQDRMQRSRPYARVIRKVIHHVAASQSEYHHPFLQQRDQIKRVGFIVVSSDRGLCGGLNSGVLRLAVSEMQQWSDKNVDTDLCLIGNKAKHFFHRLGGNIVAEADHLGDQPSVNQLVGIVKVMLDSFREGRLDALYIIANEFINTMTQKPTLTKLLPIEIDIEAGEKVGHWDYIYEPEAKELLDMLLIRYIESQVYQAVVENIACEQAAQMVAMKSATDNAGNMIDDLQLIYNKIRQSAITQEIAEVVAGAAAV